MRLPFDRRAGVSPIWTASRMCLICAPHANSRTRSFPSSCNGASRVSSVPAISLQRRYPDRDGTLLSVHDGYEFLGRIGALFGARRS